MRHPLTVAREGIAVRIWQLGIEMRPLFHKNTLWVYPVYAGIGGGFGYWLLGVEERQNAFLSEKRDALLEKRRKAAERDSNQSGGVSGLVESVKKTVGLESANDEA